MAQSRSPRAALLAVICIAAALCGCAKTTTTGTVGGAVANFDSGSTEARFRERGAQETTLADFCKNPPATTTPEAAEAIKASCRPKVLTLAGDAAVFDKGNGLYPVVFKRPIRNGDICPTGTTPDSICGNFAAGDKMHSSRINAGAPT
jgi:hypothetical protein